MKSEHFVQLYDDPETLLDRAAGFLLDGWKELEPIMVVARPSHWAGIRRSLEASGCPVDELERTGRLTVYDAATSLSAFLQNGRPVRERFMANVGASVPMLSEAFGRPVRIYGEMVDVLAARGELTAACQLEDLWNEVGAAHPIKLMCGYASGHFGDERTSPLLRTICGAHDHAVAAPDDLLAGWLLSGRSPVQ